MRLEGGHQASGHAREGGRRHDQDGDGPMSFQGRPPGPTPWFRTPASTGNAGSVPVVQTLLEPVVGVGLVVERRYLDVATGPIKGDRFRQRRIRLEPDDRMRPR